MKYIRKIISLLLVSVFVLMLASCGDDGSSSSVDLSNAPEKKTGTFVMTLYPKYAPITVENFLSLVDEGFYNGLTFHRVMDKFMAQGGDPNGNGSGGADKTIKGEFAANGVDNKLSHKRGIVSMARSKSYDSASSQFFICYADVSATLDGGYAAFGEVTEGMEVIDGFLRCERKPNARGEVAVPVYPITIEKATRLDTAEGEDPKVKFEVSYYPKEG